GVAPLEALRESGSELAVGGVVGAAPPRLSVPLVAREGAAPLCGDFDMDGDVDLLAMTSSYGVRLAFNDGQGALVAPDGVIPARFAAERRASVAADVDGDGDVDLVSVAFNEVALNDGHGRFVATPTTPPATLPPAAPGLGFAADFDLDGAEDVFWHHGSSGGVVTYGAPDLAFTATSAPTLQPRSVVAGDVDQDGDLDLLVTEEAPAALRLLLNGGRSAWTAITIDAGSPVRDAALVDLDGDGDLDAAVATRSPFSPASIAPSRFYINQGGGTFVQQTAPFTIEADAVAVGDLDGDGDLDLVFDGAGFLRTSGGWVAGGPAATGVDFLGAAVVDADEDGFGDLLCGAGAFAGAGSGGFGALQPWPAPFDYVPWPYGLWAPIPRMRAVDLDGDGDKDVVGLRPAPFVNLRRQLVLEDRPRPGRDATLVLFGAAGETGYFGFAPQLAAAPFVVPGWGAVHLDLGALTILGPSVLDGEGRSVLAVSVPQQPSLVGTWLWWQGALLGSGKLTGALRATVLGL
ncbi:MAG TPA: VCBS repeat-containing protein, partial [Planctomycetota bacterium]|nr:VCBS repeat-containing protein [Planctomycetota bacterium]